MRNEFEYYSSLFDNDFCALSGETFIVTCAILLLLYGVLYSKYESKVEKIPHLSEFGFDFRVSTLSQDFTLREYKQKESYNLESVNTNKSLIDVPEQSIKQTFQRVVNALNKGSIRIKHIANPSVYKAFTNSKDVSFSTYPDTAVRTADDERDFMYQSIETQAETETRANIPILLSNCGWHTLLILFFTCLLLKDNPIHGDLFYNCLYIDFFTRFIEISICISAFLSVSISLQYAERINTFEVLVLILLASASMSFLASASDLICVYLAIELQSLCFYVLAGLKRNSEFSTEAGLKYFLLGAFSSGILLFGCSLLYCFTGITSFSEYSHLFSEYSIENTQLGASSTLDDSEESVSNFLPLRALQLAITFILIGVLFKCSAAPFHMWAPDVYEGAPTSVTAFFSIVPKLSLFALLIRLSYTTFHECIQQTPVQTLLLFSCIASLFVGTFSAISQNKIKRLLAYSSIGHVGFILMACTIHSTESLGALLVYLYIYIVMTVAIFAIILTPLARESYSQQSLYFK